MNPLLTVDLDVLCANYAALRRSHGRVLAVVKADAYGHGLRATVRALSGADGFCVARADEALAVREQTRAPILMLGRADASELDALIDADVTLTVTDLASYGELQRASRGRLVRALIKRNVGMNRFGVTQAEAQALLKERHPWLQLEGCYAHLASAEDYGRVLRQTAGEPMRHVAATSALERTHGTVRAGLALYGYGTAHVNPCMRVQAPVVGVRRIAAGESVGYGGLFTAQRPTTVATVGIGYGDGFPRVENRGFVTIGGKRCPVIGAVCMDVLFADATQTDVRIGDRVTVMDDAQALADTLQIPPHALLTCWTARLARSWVQRSKI